MSMSQREIGGVLGVDHKTVGRDLGASAPPEPDMPEEPQVTEPGDTKSGASAPPEPAEPQVSERANPEPVSDETPEPDARVSSWLDAIEDYCSWLSAGGSSAATLRLRRHYLKHLAASVPDADPWEVTPEQVTAYIAGGAWQAETRKSARSSARSFYQWAVNTGRTHDDPTRTLRPVRTPIGVPKPCPETVIRAALDNSSARDRLMVLLGATCGLRISEIAAVHSDDLTERGDGAWLRITGKGGRTRVVPVSPPLDHLLRTQVYGFVFPGSDGGHMTGAHVGKLLKRLLGNHSAHELRHRYATVTYAAERDLFAVQHLLGHSQPQTTARYTQIPDGALRAGARHAALD
jgi:integrase